MKSPGILSWKRLENILSKGLKAFFCYVLLFALLRAWFIFWMQDYIGAEANWNDILTALWRGMCLSCQTAGMLTLVAFVPAFLFHYIYEPVEKYVWDVVTGLELITISVLYVAAFPYYRQFHSNFNQLVCNAVNDDMTALFWSFMQEFYLPLRLAAALVMAFMLWRIMGRLMAWKFCDILSLFYLPTPVIWAKRALFLACCGCVVLLGIFGGSLRWQTAVDWENAGVTKDRFLNEAILDSFQALYRGYRLQHRMLACNGLSFTVSDIREMASKLAGLRHGTDNLDDYLLRHAQGAQIEKPTHIFVILSESYANWPLLDEYAEIPIADGMKSIIREPDSAYVKTFLPNGSSTVSAVTGITTGLADANLYLTVMPEAFTEPYPTASAPQMKQLGYATYFWYAGPSTWERIEDFTLAQGFDNFHSRGDYGDIPGTVWGCEDKYLYDIILERISPEEAGFHVILNASNHSPYGVNLEAEGFPGDLVRSRLPESARNDDELLKELGHYWYADRELARFIREAKEKLPDSLFIVVGDHADRYNIEKNPSTYIRYGIPFIITGKGVHKGLLTPGAAGSQIDIVPTIIELIAPEGFTYYALGNSLSRSNRRGVNYGFWIQSNAIGAADTDPLVPEALDGGSPPDIDNEEMQDYINAIRSISWWRAKYGAILDENKLEE